MIYEAKLARFGITLPNGKEIKFQPVRLPSGTVVGVVDTEDAGLRKRTGLSTEEINAVIEASGGFKKSMQDGATTPGLGIWKRNDRQTSEQIAQEEEGYELALKAFGDKALSIECKERGIHLPKNATRLAMVNALLELRKTGKVTVTELVGGSETAKSAKSITGKAAANPPAPPTVEP